MNLAGERHTLIEASDLGLGLYLTFATEREWVPADLSVGEPSEWRVSAELREARFAGTLLDLTMLCASMGPGWRSAVEETERERLLADLGVSWAREAA